MIVVPVAIAAGPAVPDSSQPEPTFDAQYEAFNAWERNTAAPGMNALATATYQNALESKARAESASASEEAAITAKNGAVASAAAASASAVTASTKAGEAAASAATAAGAAGAAGASAVTANTKAGEANASAVAAQAARDAAQAYRDQAEAFATEQLIASSATNVTPGAGIKLFAIEPSRSFVTGMYLVATSIGTPTASLTGYVVSYDGNTGALSLGVDKFTGAGAHADWLIGVAAAGAVDTASAINAAALKAVPVDDDKLGLVDSAAGNVLKGLTFASLKAAIRTWFLGLANTWTDAQTFGAITAASLNGGQFAGLRNKVLNGGFSVNQRGYASGAATTAGQYTFDRWKVTAAGGITFATVANKTTVTIPAGQTLQQVVDGLDLQAGNYVLSWEGTAQGRIAGGAYGASGAVTAAIAGGANTTIEFNAGTVTRVQLELGAVKTPFENRPYSLELASCQRYYFRWTPTAIAQVAGTGYASLATSAQISVQFPVPMRALVSSVEHSGTPADYSVLHQNNVAICNAAPGISSGGFTGVRLALNVAAGVLTVGNGVMLYAQNANAFLGFSADL